MQKVNSMDTETVQTEITPEPHIKEEARNISLQTANNLKRRYTVIKRNTLANDLRNMLKKKRRFTLLKRVKKEDTKGNPIPGTLEDELCNQEHSFLKFDERVLSPK